MLPRMRVVLTALALMAFAFVFNLVGDLSAASSSTGPITLLATEHVAIEPPRTPRVRARAEASTAAKVVTSSPRRAEITKPRKSALLKAAAVAQATPETAKIVAVAKAEPGKDETRPFAHIGRA